MRYLLAMALPFMLANSATAQERVHAPIISMAASAVAPTLPQAADLQFSATEENSEAELTEIGSGMASYYGRELAGNRTANGERFNPDELTAAHRTLAFGSKVLVTNMATGQSVVVRINDRGPFGGHKRVIDVSHAAAKEIGLHRSGTAKVKMALLAE